jgi:hypothetical protein
MWRPVLSLLALGALALPAVAAAQPREPEPPAPPVWRGTPYLVLEDGGRLTLRLRLDRPIERRFDGELQATAVIDGRIASVQPVAGRRPARTHCYAASAQSASGRPGRLVSVSVVLDGPPTTAVTALVAVRAPRRGDERGAPLRC